MKAVPVWAIACLILVLTVLTGVHEAVATIYSIRVDRAARQKFGLYYPVTYKFAIPAGLTGLAAEYRYSESGQWMGLQERSGGDLFNGIDAVRFDRSGGFAFMSVRFASESDVIQVRVIDGRGRELDISFDSIPRYYDDRRGAVTVTLDDYGTWSDPYFRTAADMLAARGLFFSVGVITRQVYDWNLFQELVNSHWEHLEVASHSDYHHCYGDTYEQGSYDNETAWSRDVLRNNVSFCSNPYIPLFIEPCGYSDADLAAAVTRADYLVTRSVVAGYPAGANFAPWDAQQGRYGRASVVFNDYNMPNDAKLMNDANALFDRAISDGGMYHLLDHPAMGLWQEESFFARHLDHVSGRSDLWYVPFGHLYQYHFLQEMRGNLSIQPFVPGTPVAAFSARPVSGRAPMTVSFTDSSPGRITAWQWDFGDGQRSSERSPVHTYTSSGSYTAWLVVTDGTRYSAPESITIAANEPYRIGTSVVGNGSIACNPGREVGYLTDVSCIASAGYGSRLAELSVDGVPRTVTDSASFTWHFGAVDSDHSISARFVPVTYTVTFASAGHGSITGAVSQSVEHGGSTSAVTATPAAGYRFVNWTGPNGFASTSNPLQIGDVTSSIDVTAHFAANPHTVTPRTDAAGTLSPAGPQVVDHEGRVTFTVTPQPGYATADVTGCGGTRSGTSYTTGPIVEDCSVTATFTRLTYPVTESVGAGFGSVACASPVPHGMQLSCDIAPEAGYMIASVKDNGVDVTGSVTSGRYVSGPVTGEHAIVAVFAPAPYTLVDAVKVQQQVLGKVQLSDREKARLDVAPLGKDGVPEPNGILDVADVVIMLRKLVGALDW